MSNCAIFDFETLSNDTRKGVVLSFAILQFNEDRYTTDPYSFDELVDSALYQKYSVSEQVEKYKRKIDQHTIDWWLQQDTTSIDSQFKPKDADVSITELYTLLTVLINPKSIDKVFSRGDFDVQFLDSICLALEKSNPLHWGKVRDVRSYLDGMLFGVDGFDNQFIPKEIEGRFFPHDPRYDIAADVIRMQTCARLIAGIEE